MTSDGNLGRELLKQNGGALPPPGGHQAPVQGLIDQERRRVHLWAWITVLLWGSTAVHAIALRGIYVLFSLYFSVGKNIGAEEYGRMLMLVSNLAGLLAPLLLVAAALCTVKFIVVSRQATLKQIRAELAEISQQVRALTRTP